MLDGFSEGVLQLVELGLNHEQQHQELIVMDIKHALWSAPLRWDATRKRKPRPDGPGLSWIGIEGGIHSIGHDGRGFAFDNEGPRHRGAATTFSIASRQLPTENIWRLCPTTATAVPNCGFRTDGTQFQSQEWNAPLYWERHDDGSWQEFVAGGRKAGTKEINSPSQFATSAFIEADAYARWSGARLPDRTGVGDRRLRTQPKGTFLEDDLFHPQAATRAQGFQQVFGDVWEWTASPYVGLSRISIRARERSGEYNGKFMCNQFVLRGGSCATPASHIRATYRNFFPPHTRWQFSGLRLAK